jgi:hypothetical protein
MAEPKTSQVVLVAGFNYNAWVVNPKDPHEHVDGTNFRIFAERRMEFLLKRMPDAKFTLFEFGTGKVDVSEKPSKKGAKRKWQTVKTFTKITRKDNYDKHEFKKNPAGVMSITDVYAHIIGIGTKEPGTLKELSIFSHAWVDGVILVNSYDNTPDTSLARDPADKDARASKDFKAPNMTAAQRKAFGDAFGMGGEMWIWGCDATTSYVEVFLKIANSPTYRQAKPGKLDPATKFKFEFTAKWADQHYEMNRDFFPAQTAAGKELLQFERTLAEIEKFYDQAIDGTYSKAVASAGRALAYGALPGMGASLQGKDGLMSVIRDASPEGKLNTSLWEFYKRVVNQNEDYESRGYGTFIPIIPGRRRPRKTP